MSKASDELENQTGGEVPTAGQVAAATADEKSRLSGVRGRRSKAPYVEILGQAWPSPRGWGFSRHQVGALLKCGDCGSKGVLVYPRAIETRGAVGFVSRPQARAVGCRAVANRTFPLEISPVAPASWWPCPRYWRGDRPMGNVTASASLAGSRSRCRR